MVLATALTLAGSAQAGALRFESDGGIACTVVPRSSPLTAVQLWVSAGAAHDTPGCDGLAHFVEHALWSQHAGDDVPIDARTSYDYTVFATTVLADHLARAIGALGRCVGSLELDRVDMNRERQIIRAEIAARASERPGRRSHSVDTELLAGTPYARSILGTESSIERIAPRTVGQFIAGHYGRRRARLVVAGPHGPEALVHVVDDAFAGLEADSAELVAADVAPFAVQRRFEHGPGAVVGLRGAGAGRPEGVALELAAAVFDGSDWEGLGRVRARADVFRAATTAIFESESDLEPAVLGQRLVDHLRALSSDRLSLARRRLAAGHVFETETVMGLAFDTGRREMLGREPSRWLRLVDDLSAEHLYDAVARSLSPAGASASARVAAYDGAAVAPSRRRTPVRKPARARRHGTIATETLPSGVTVIVRPDRSVGVVAVRAAWLGGALLEPDGRPGLHHLLAAAMRLGCGRRDAAQVDRSVAGMSGTLEGVSGRNSFGVRGEWISAAWRDGLELFADCVLAPRFDAPALEEARRRVLSELGAAERDAATRAHRMALAALFPGHPHGRDLFGAATAIAEIGQDELRRFYRSRYPLNGLVVSVAGDVDTDEVLGWARRRFVGESAASTVPVAAGPSQEPRAGELFDHADTDEAQVVVGFRTAGVGHPDRLALDVLASVLDRGIHAELRRRGIAYEAGVVNDSGFGAGYLAVHFAADPARAAEGLAVVRDQLERVAGGRLAEEEVRSARDDLLGSYQRGLERRLAVATSLALHKVYGLGVSRFIGYPAALAGVVIADVERVAGAYLGWDQAVVTTVTGSALAPGAARRAKGVRRRPKPRRKR